MKIPDSRQERRRFIKEHLYQYQDKSFYCRALDCDVKVTDKSIEETAFQAAISKQATKLALRITCGNLIASFVACLEIAA